MPAPAPLPPAFVALMRLGLVFRREFAAAMAREPWARAVDAAPPMYAVLRAVAFRPGASQRALADVVMVDPSDLVPVLDRMSRNGWVTRDRDPDDRRRLRVHLTPAGTEVLGRFEAVAERVAEALLSGLSPDERAEFARLVFRAIGPHDPGQGGPDREAVPPQAGSTAPAPRVPAAAPRLPPDLLGVSRDAGD